MYLFQFYLQLRAFHAYYRCFVLVTVQQPSKFNKWLTWLSGLNVLNYFLLHPFLCFWAVLSFSFIKNWLYIIYSETDFTLDLFFTLSNQLTKYVSEHSFLSSHYPPLLILYKHNNCCHFLLYSRPVGTHNFYKLDLLNNFVASFRYKIKLPARKLAYVNQVYIAMILFSVLIYSLYVNLFTMNNLRSK